MIKITHEKGRITIEGHAGYAPAGQDIVCAAVSALVQTFIASVGELTHDEIEALRNEQGQIQTIQYKSLSTPGQVLLGSFLIGIRMIAESYPGNLGLTQHLSHKTGWDGTEKQNS
jgi:uncharacterized protein YsxB (DUF464 family)